MTERNRTIDKLRGICMLGVLGIHTGSLALMCASPNPHLYMLLEILSLINPARSLTTANLSKSAFKAAACLI